MSFCVFFTPSPPSLPPQLPPNTHTLTHLHNNWHWTEESGTHNSAVATAMWSVSVWKACVCVFVRTCVRMCVCVSPKIPVFGVWASVSVLCEIRSRGRCDFALDHPGLKDGLTVATWSRAHTQTHGSGIKIHTRSNTQFITIWLIYLLICVLFWGNFDPTTFFLPFNLTMAFLFFLKIYWYIKWRIKKNSTSEELKKTLQEKNPSVFHMELCMRLLGFSWDSPDSLATIINGDESGTLNWSRVSVAVSVNGCRNYEIV